MLLARLPPPLIQQKITRTFRICPRIAMIRYMEEMVPAKRFELATDPVARERIDFFRDAIKAFQHEHPEVLGATVFGSMIKGDRAGATSDVDAFLYIDGEAIPEEMQNENTKDIEDRYRSDLLQKMGVSSAEARSLYGDLFPKLLSTEVVNRNIQANVVYERARAEKTRILMETDTSDMTPEQKEQLYDPPENAPTDDFEIGGMFHARVGSGIEKYRKLYLEKLAQLPDKELAESIWSGVYAQLETMEAGDKKRRVPRTLEDALKTYHPELYESVSTAKDTTQLAELFEKLKKSFPETE